MDIYFIIFFFYFRVFEGNVFRVEVFVVVGYGEFWNGWFIKMIESNLFFVWWLEEIVVIVKFFFVYLISGIIDDFVVFVISCYCSYCFSS